MPNDVYTQRLTICRANLCYVRDVTLYGLSLNIQEVSGLSAVKICAISSVREVSERLDIHCCHVGTAIKTELSRHFRIL